MPVLSLSGCSEIGCYLSDASVLMLLVVLSQQILTIVVSVGGADDDVDVLVDGTPVGIVLSHADGGLVVEFDKNDRAVDAVVENGVLAGVADPGKMGAIEVGFHFFHANFGVSLLHVTNVEGDEIA